MFIVYQIKAVLVALVLMFFILLPTVVLATPFSLRRRLKIISPVWQYCSRMLLRHACMVKIDICEDHRSPGFQTVPGEGLYISNHQSFVDIPLCFSMFQIPPIMKKEVLYIPIFGWLAWISGAMPVSRSNNHSRKKVLIQARKRFKHLRIGVQLYPEGTRSKDARPKQYSDIKKPLLIFAFKEKIPVIPTSIYGTRGTLSKFGIVNPHRHVGMIIHKEMDPRDYATPEEFSRACWEKVRAGHDQIMSQLSHLN